ncbi:uncharacterized protein N0V89_005672 [Didymosphaeria variabile]|uniref:Uncharacterized protein n=1 Tax=Didymosphaeria variabile TaxID=1932322 RepID=A0A9W8XNM3_9PLEO|nr:uncharacterized protein N0V89_005672 [Didymosphaeria variabile]KAJ4353940.1 hypothetical protein N0V89_005672 [Didymosphaeria variabile]
MSDSDPIENAIEDITTLANCWLTLLPMYDCNTTTNRVREVVNEVSDSIEPTILKQADYQALMHEASLLLRDWLKFEHQAKPLIESGFNKVNLMEVSVAFLKNPPKPLKFKTPYCVRVQGDLALILKGVTFKIPAGHLMARCMNLEVRFVLDTMFRYTDQSTKTSPINPAAVSRGEVTVDEHGKVTAFKHLLDLTRMVASGRKKFEKALVDYIGATFGLDEEA